MAMGSMPFAFSVHHFITSVGADAGFAAIVGLAILVLLFFAQARETSTLREQAYESAQRVQQLEARLAQLSGRPQATGPQASVPPVPPPPGVARALANRAPSAGTTAPGAAPAAGATAAGATAAGAAAAGATAAAAATAASRPAAPGAPRQPLVPVAPAGVGAPALTAATKLIPTPDNVPVSEDSPTAAPTAAPIGPAETVAAATAVADPPIDATAVGSLPPATAVANGAPSAAPPPIGAGSGPYDGEGGTGGRRGTVPPAGPPRAQIRPTTRTPGGRGSSGLPPSTLGSPPRSSSPRGVRALVIGIGALAVAGVVAALLIITSSGGTNVATHTSTHNNTAAARHHQATVVAFRPSTVTVAVLNGTSTSGLAARIASKLTAAGYKQGAITNAQTQTQTSSVVAYMPGAKNDAVEVAASLKLPASSVQPIDSSTRSIACPSTSCNANVVVTAGTDLASSASSSSSTSTAASTSST